MLHIPDVLTSEEAAQLRDRLLAAQWVDGNATSGAGAAQAKRNRQLPEDAPTTHAAQETVSRALMNNATFLSAAADIFNCKQRASFRETSIMYFKQILNDFKI